jgi:hypothetical protein
VTIIAWLVVAIDRRNPSDLQKLPVDSTSTRPFTHKVIMSAW